MCNHLVEVISSISETVQILEENYSVRNAEKDLSGYVLIAENIGDIEILGQDKLQGLVAEYTDIIECSEGELDFFTILISSDFAIIGKRQKLST